ncbi:MAG: alanine--tRNA ligase [Bacilli bacterium]|nr:alanine--tRNA ligase [Bacilli bacterium]MCH4210326.1 alanine--tRNA ligase [Bacilli bacterium]MCH4278106.1 alanine--tRNA ligase [Bacilli bacterium]
MKALTGQQIRETWIKFFESKGHKWLPGVSLIPQGDKSLLWVNAGVTGLKKYFDGSEIPPCRRIVNVQKSIRTNDIENVGHTARHHTFFEMLGNFSIGDYFRKEVIAWAIEILTDPVKGFGMPLDKLYMTYNPSDKDSLQYWQDNGVSKDHLIALEGNYWQIGEGPCGPNTEVFFDRGEKWDPKHLGVKLLQDDIENDRYIELWGIVFSQFNAVNGVPREKYKELPRKNIDTGAGLERIACILQNTPTNFETDLFTPIIHYVEGLSKMKYEEPNLMAFRVIADHARCLTFALSDGASFSNEGRGYVLRRIIRRAMRYGQKLGLKGAFMYRLVQVVADSYKCFYPELEGHVEEVSKLIYGEEEKFLKTLSTGEDLLREMLSGKKQLTGEEVFKLYDTYGFPSDLTKEIALESGVSCDMDGFSKCMEEQRERARNARGEIESFHKQSKDLMSCKLDSVFTYDKDSTESKVLALFEDGVAVKSIVDEGEAIFDVTPCYAEMGGQVSDSGSIVNKDVDARITEVGKAPNGQHLHFIKVNKGELKVGDVVTVSVDLKKRRLIERNHSATHLMHSALMNVLGEHVKQMGSYVDENYLRFDFMSNRKLSEQEIASINDEVNEKIVESIPEVTEILPIEEAKNRGAEMEFSEKYGKVVRVVEFGEYSREFCGGTHVKNSADIGLFIIESEDAVASGVRRITARTSLGAYQYLSKRVNNLNKAESLLGASDVDVISHISSLQSNNQSLNKELSETKQKLASLDAKSLSGSGEKIDGHEVFITYKEGASREDLLQISDSLKSNRQDYVIVLLGGKEGARPLVCFVGGESLQKVSAGNIVKLLAKELGGGGGGKNEMATGQLKKGDNFINLAHNILKESL